MYARGSYNSKHLTFIPQESQCMLPSTFKGRKFRLYRMVSFNHVVLGGRYASPSTYGMRSHS